MVVVVVAVAVAAAWQCSGSGGGSGGSRRRNNSGPPKRDVQLIVKQKKPESKYVTTSCCKARNNPVSGSTLIALNHDRIGRWEASSFEWFARPRAVDDGTRLKGFYGFRLIRYAQPLASAFGTLGGSTMLRV